MYYDKLMNITNFLKFLFLLLAFLFNFSFVKAQDIKNIDNIEAATEEQLKSLIEQKKFFWVIYDSVCPYCKSSRKYIKELDWENKFKFLSYRDPETYKVFPNLSKEECEKDIHMVTPTGEVLVGYGVFRTIIDNLTATKLLNPLLQNNYAEKKLEDIYDKMVKKRSCYYKKSTCPLKKKGNPSQK